MWASRLAFWAAFLLTMTLSHGEENVTETKKPSSGLFAWAKDPTRVQQLLDKHPWVRENMRRDVRRQLVQMLDFMSSGGDQRVAPEEVVKASQVVAKGISDNSIGVSQIVPQIPSYFLLDAPLQLKKMLEILKEQDGVSQEQKESMDVIMDFMDKAVKGEVQGQLLEPILAFLPSLFQGFGIFALALLEEGFSFSG